MIGEHDWKGPATYQSDNVRQELTLRKLSRFPWAPEDIKPESKTHWLLIGGIWKRT